MTHELAGRVAIITGAGGGIGRRIALAFVRAGASVTVVDVKEEGCEDTVTQIRAEVGPGRGLFVVADIADVLNIPLIVRQTVEKFG